MGVENRFNVNDFAVCLTLKQRLGATQKWHIEPR